MDGLNRIIRVLFLPFSTTKKCKIKFQRLIFHEISRLVNDLLTHYYQKWKFSESIPAFTSSFIKSKILPKFNMERIFCAENENVVLRGGSETRRALREP